MKMKNGVLFSVLMSAFCFGGSAKAVIFPDQEVTAASDRSDENENSDAASRFGSFNQQKRQANSMIVHPLSPISESSFEQDANRAPASAPIAGRGPAGVTEAKGVIQLKPITTSKKALMRQAKKNHATQEVAIIASELGFFPSTIFLTEGVPVRLYITGASSKTQCFMLDQFGVRRQVRNQKVEEVTFTPDQSGSFSFNCPMNGARGTVVVKEIDLGESSRAPASIEVSHSESSVPVEEKKSDISDSDFEPQFRN